MPKKHCIFSNFVGAPFRCYAGPAFTRWFDTAQHGTAQQHGTARHSTAQHGTARCTTTLLGMHKAADLYQVQALQTGSAFRE